MGCFCQLASNLKGIKVCDLTGSVEVTGISYTTAQDPRPGFCSMSMTEALTLEPVSESTGRLIKRDAGSDSQSFQVSRSEIGPENLHF